jgi:TonB-linked SusC/RagA family outer membrane protein
MNRKPTSSTPPSPPRGVSRSGQGRTGLALLFAALALAVVASPGAAQHQVSGTVTTEELAPMGGVMVIVKGTRIGTITNSSGIYSLTAPSPQDTLVFSSLGAATREIPINGRTTIAVTMQQQAIALDELVVVGYGTQARALVTGSVSSINASDIERTTGATSGEALLGKIQGINVRRGSTNMGVAGRDPQDGRPGAAPRIQIRNYGEPLYVIDGVPREARDFHHLNAADIENVSILKDASASVYGFRAANGVILVTTKKGQVAQRPQFRLDGYYGWQNLPRSRMPFGYGVTAYQQIYSYLEHEQNVGIPRSRTPEEMQQWLHAPTYETWPVAVSNPNAPMGNLNASVSGGSDDSNYYLSLGHLSQDYVQVDNNFNRSNVQANLRAMLFEGLSIGTELRGRIENQATIAASSVYDPVQNLMRGVQSPHPHQPFYANNNPDYLAGDVRILARSPVTMRRDISGYQDQIRRNATGNFWAEYSFPFGTTVKGTYAYGYDTEQLEYQTKTFDGYCYDAATDTYNICGQVLSAVRRHLRGQYETDFAQIMANQSFTFRDHSLSTVGAFELNGGERWVTHLVSVPPSNYSHIVNLVDVSSLQNTWDPERRASYAGRVNYDFRKKYLLEGVGRYDGSYLFPADRRWGFFPGVSAGWRITEEPFLRDRAPFLDELKLRVSWGQAGREQLPGNNANWSYLGGATYGVGNGAVLDGQQITGIRPRGLPITNLSWVTSTATNVGVDFALFRGRVTGELDAFERKLTGLPASRYDVTLPVEVGYSLPNENLNSETNVGVDGSLTFNGNVGNLVYSISPNATLARRKTLDRYKPRYGNSWDQYRTGQEHRWFGVNFGYEVIGQFESMDEIYNHPVNIDLQGNRSLLPGDWIYRDVNGDGLINALDMRPIAYNTSTTGLPILSWGLGGQVGYGPLSLAYDFYGGNYYSIATDLDRKIPFNADHGGAAYWNSRWRRADVFNDQSEWIPGRYPPLRRGDQNHSSYRDNSFTVTNLNFMRVQRVEVGFAVPTSLSSRIGASSARLYTSVANPYVVTFYGQDWSQDPESAGGQSYPYATVTNVGFSATLGGGPRSPVVVPVPPTADDN